jgi:hypothetical protein
MAPLCDRSYSGRLRSLILVMGVIVGFGCASDPVESDSELQWERVAEEAIDPSGGTIAADELTLEIPAGAFESNAVLAIEQVASTQYTLEDPRQSAISSVYRVTGVPNIHEPLKIEITFDPSDLPSIDSCFVYIEEEVFVSADGEWVTRGRPLLSSQVDRTTGTVSAEIAPDIGSASVPGFFSKNNSVLVGYTITATRFGGFEALTDGSQFKICWQSGQVSEEWLEDLMIYLASAKTHLESLGMVFTTSPGEPIEVQVEPLPTGRNGEFVQSHRGVDHSYLRISPNVSGDLMQATAGHELFHLLQMCYGAHGHVFGYDYNWIAEACSVWFEAVFLRNPNFLPSVQEDNRNFIKSPLEYDDLEHGYGASRFLTHLTEQFGDSMITEVLTEIRTQSADDGDGVAAIMAVLDARGESLSQEYAEFVQLYTTKETGHTSWSTSDPELLLFTPNQTTHRFARQMTDLSAHHINASLNWGGESDVWGRLDITLNSTASEHLKGDVYVATIGSGPWTFTEQLSGGAPYTIVDFGWDEIKWVKVLIYRNEAEAPFDQNESAACDISFAAQDGFPVTAARFDLWINGVDVDGSDHRYDISNSGRSGTMTSPTTFSYDDLWEDEEAGFVSHTVFYCTLDVANRRITDWHFRRDYTSTEDNVQATCYAWGGAVGAEYQGTNNSMYAARGDSVCAVVDQVFDERIENGVVTRVLNSPSCDVFSKLEIYLTGW